LKTLENSGIETLKPVIKHYIKLLKPRQAIHYIGGVKLILNKFEISTLLSFALAWVHLQQLQSQN